MATMQSRYAGKCASCGARFRKGTLIDYNRSAPKGLKARHVDCSAIETDDRGLVTLEGDNRVFARTRYGLRAGYENTGVRCEDAPCCGCC